MTCYFFGCHNQPGHFLWSPAWRSSQLEFITMIDGCHVDGSLAPMFERSGVITFVASFKSRDDRQRARNRLAEAPQGVFLVHHLPNGFTAMSWWDRAQGDARGACNSTVFLKGTHDAETMKVALATHFPSVLANLARNGIELRPASEVER